MKLAKMKPGMILYDRHRTAMGNTTVKVLGEWPVEIVAVQENGVQAKWNGNPARFIATHIAEKWKTWSYRDDCAEAKFGWGGNHLISVKLKKGSKVPPPKMVPIHIKPEDL